MAVAVPERIQKAMIKVVGDTPLKALVDDSEAFNRFITCRKAPTEEANLRMKLKEIEELVLADPAKFRLPKFPTNGDEIAEKNFISRKNQKVKEILKQRVYGWQAINYDQHKSLQYLISRSAVEYAIIMRIFREIQRRDPNFKPASYFDFGSGVGTGVWAAAEMWKQTIYEYYLVDPSRDMNDLSGLILRDGDENKDMFLKNVYFRQFLPAREDKYDIVLSSHTLFEMPSLKNRLEVANNLWNKAQQYLIFVEVGTKAGFHILNEIRDFLMEVKAKQQQEAFIFSPCTHESPCPRYELNDGTPCNFDIVYKPLNLTESGASRKSTYSYLVIKKGTPSEADRWPRIIRPTMLRHKHVICRMCTEHGKIQEGIFTASKHGKPTMKCAKHSSWGDQLPIKVLLTGNECRDDSGDLSDDSGDSSDDEEQSKSENADLPHTK